MFVAAHDECSQAPIAFDPILNSHNLPLPIAHQKQIDHLISSLECNLSSLNVGVNACDGRLTSPDGDIDTIIARSTLQSTRIKFADHLDSLHTAIAPHRRLPDDILLAIFALCVPSPIKVPLPRAWPHANPFAPLPVAWQTAEPWNLLAVCTRWRHLVLGAPTLWSNLVFQFRQMSHYTRHAHFFKDLLTRSGESTLLKLEIRAEDWESRWTGHGATHLTSELIIAHASRFRELTLALPASVLDPFLASSPTSAAFDQLERVFVEYPANNVVDSAVTRRVFSDAHRLRRFAIHGRLPSCSLELPWEQLSELHLGRTTGTAEDCHRILQRCPNLVSCTISFFEPTLSPPHPPNLHQPSLPLTTLPHLASFALDCSPLAPFLTRLQLPALSSLTLHTDIDRTSCDTALLPLLALSPCLTHLTLTWWVPSDTIKTLLRAVPRLTHFHFVPGKTAEVFKLLWAVDLAPRLECLTFVCYPVIWEEVVEIIGLRGLVGRLKEVHIETFFRKDVEVWERDPRMRTLREMGMRLELTNRMEGRCS